MHRCSGRLSNKDPLFLTEAIDHGISIFGRDGNFFVQLLFVINARNDGTGHVFKPFQAMEGIVRLHEKVMAGVPPAYEIREVAS